MANEKQTDKTPEKFDPTKVQRNKCLAWDPKGNAGKGAGVYTSDLLNDDGSVNVEECKRYGVDPASVSYITFADLDEHYRKGPREAVAHAAKLAKMTTDDYIYSLVISDAMQDAANASVKAHRPVTDRAKDRAASTLRKVLEAQGKSAQEIDALLAALK